MSRKKGETILVGADITIKVVEVRGNLVRLGITAPKEVKIYREELLPVDPTEPVK